MTDRSTASWRICCSARAVSSWIWRSAFLTMPSGFGPRLLPHLFPQPLGVGSALRDDGLGLDARLADDLRRFLLQPLQLLPGLLRIVERLSDRLLPAVERLRAAAPTRTSRAASAGPET